MRALRCSSNPSMRLSSELRIARATSKAGAVLLGALAPFCPALACAAESPPSAQSLVARLGLEEAPTPVRERNDWRVPKKIVMLGASSARERDAIAAAAPGAQVVVAPSVAAAAQAATDADILIGSTGASGVCNPEILGNAKALRWIQSMSAGVERCIALPSVHRRNLLITNMRRVESGAIAEHAIALALALARGIDTFVMDKTRARWGRADAASTEMQVLAGKTMLVVGLGGIGTEVAKRAHALDMKVVATRASSHDGPDFVSYVGLPDEMPRLAASADVIVNCAPLTPQTTGLFDAKFFAGLRPTAFFINVARGGSVVTADLVDALESERIAGAGLDVVDPEPLPPDHPLWRAPNVIITPHVASMSDLPNDERWAVVRENLRRYVAGDRMLSVVDLERGY